MPNLSQIEPKKEKKVTINKKKGAGTKLHK